MQLSTKPTPWRTIALAGPLAAIFFMASLFGFAALRADGYTHATKAVSELGAAGAPYAHAFNILGFIAPGALVIILALSILNSAQPKRGRIGGSLLALSGAGLIAAGAFPVDMNAPEAFSSTAHFIGATSSGLLWATALFFLGPLFKRDFGFSLLGRLSVFFCLFLIANLLWQISWRAMGWPLPGWGQRIGFLGYFLWCFWVGAAVFFASPRKPD